MEIAWGWAGCGWLWGLTTRGGRERRKGGTGSGGSTIGGTRRRGQAVSGLRERAYDGACGIARVGLSDETW